jgi:serine/threonine-protein kinase
MTDEMGPKGALVGAVLDGKYSIVRQLGRGGMGEVYEARHEKIGRRVAVKFLRGELAHREEIATRFEKEARAAGGIEHENIAAVFDAGSLPDGTQYLVMEYLEGEDLRHLLARVGRLPLSRAADLLLQACRGLAAVHQRGIVHRDLKPANLFVTTRANGTDLLKVLDFGVAKHHDPDGQGDSTKTGTPLGSPQYMSPEQALGERDIGPQSDVFSLGVVLYELLSGQRPYEGGSFLKIVHNILTKPPAPLQQVCPDLPGPVYDIVHKAMAMTPSERFRGVSELAEALEPFRGSASRPSPPASDTASDAGPETRIETIASPPSGEALQSMVGLTRAASPPRKARTVALGAMAACAVIAVGAWQTRGTRHASAVATADAGSSTPDLSGSSSPAGHSSAEAIAAEDAAAGPPAASAASSASGAARAAQMGRKPSPPSKAPCKLTHTVDRDGNMHFSTDCPPTTR